MYTRNEYWKSRVSPKDYTNDEFIYKGKQVIAMRRVRQALNNGTLTKSNVCQVCGDECDTVAHHWRGYDHPFDVWWVCRKDNAWLPHNKIINLYQAKKIAIKKEHYGAMGQMKFHEWLENETFPCGSCGVSDKGDMMKLVQNYYGDYIILCQVCASKLE